MRFSAIQAWLRESPPIRDDGTRPGPAPSFAELWAPIAAGAGAVLASSLTDGPEPGVIQDLRDDLTGRLSEVGEAVVWQFFNTHRTLPELVKAHLQASDAGFPRTLYCRALEALRADGLVQLTDEYPVLARHLGMTVASWLDSSRELLERVRRDRNVLAETFGLPSEAGLVGVRTGLSDPHRGGRTVAILTFATAADTRAVVYKPKDLEVDAAYNALISDLSRATPGAPPLRSLTVLPREGYGYAEYVGHRICESDEELRGFYRNAGRLTAILYILGCNDCHYENVIAHGDQLILVDGETLFQGTLHPGFSGAGVATARAALDTRLADSVVRIGLLPHWFFVGPERMPRDFSALGIESRKSAHEKFTGWLALNTDGMVTGDAERTAAQPMSLPVGIGTLNPLNKFSRDYCAGFEGQLKVVVANKDSWLASNGYLERFRDQRCRFIRRPTWTYMKARGQLLEPAAMTSETAQREVLERLGQSIATAAGVTDDAVFDAELAQLRDLDVPFFEHSNTERDLRLGDGACAAGFFSSSGLASARRRIESLDSEEIHLQLTLINGLLSVKDRLAHRDQQPDLSLADATVELPTAGTRLGAAIAIGELLSRTAVSDDTGSMEWLGIDSAVDAEHSCYGPLGPSLYSGRTGIALFLAALARAQSDQRTSGVYARAAAGACADLVRLLADSALDKQRWWREKPLGLAGAGGQLLALILLNDQLPDLSRAADTGLPALLNSLDPETVRADEDLDVIFGCAGLIGPLLKIGTPLAVQLARVAGDHLVDRQGKDGGWVVPSTGGRALTGFSHGASGRAAALGRLAAVTGQGSYREAAERALGYERSQFVPAEGNWPDYRRTEIESEEPRFMLSWCHGAPGIALARLCLKTTPLWDDAVNADLEHALNATTDLTRPEDSLCCGRSGRAAILRAAGRRDGDPRWTEAADNLEGQVLANRRARDAFSFGEVLGLFQGAAGVGLALLDGLPCTAAPLLPMILSAALID
ncbi:hypothetical protein A5745_08760 [Mycobacterium sp. IS-2888]|nr:hypothetical protein A5745_08760 [Mycobacterium sp. IS-2888]